MKAYTNGNREVKIVEHEGAFTVASNVWDGTKWQYGTRRTYRTMKAADKFAQAQVAKISAGWTAHPNWTVSQS